MRASRLLSILILLQLRGRLTAAGLADEFEVSERTIYRDIDALSAAGIPVYGDRGPGGGTRSTANNESRKPAPTGTEEVSTRRGGGGCGGRRSGGRSCPRVVSCVVCGAIIIGHW